MNLEDKKRRQNLKIFISEALMVFCVLVMVVVLGFLVSGYWLNSDLEIERQGMLQVSSTPTAANVEIDGKSAWLQVTNMSKVLPVGEHEVVLTREGYDSWAKTINISEGLLYRIHYPRLFLLEREKEIAYDTTGVTKIFYTDNRRTALLFSGDINLLDTSIYADPTAELMMQKNEIAYNWAEVDFTQEKITTKTITYKNVFNFFAEPKVTTKTDKEKLKNFGFNGELIGTEKLFFYTFYDDDYLAILNESNITIYKKSDDTPIFEKELSFIPEKTNTGHNGEFILFSNGSSIASLDMETLTIYDWTVDGAKYGWLDEDMLYSIKDGELFVYDYDGLNRRSLAKDVSEEGLVFIIDDKWLYYFNENNLMREWLITR